MLNVPSCECLGRPSAPSGLGWISQGGEEMGQSSTHILRQLHAGFLKNAKPFFFFFPFLGTSSDPGVGFVQAHGRVCPEPCVPLPAQEAAPGAGAAAFCPPAKHDPHHPGTGAPFPASLRNAECVRRGQNPAEAIEGTGRHQRQQGSFFSRGHVCSTPMVFRSVGAGGRAGMMLLLQPGPSGCEPRDTAPRGPRAAPTPLPPPWGAPRGAAPRQNPPVPLRCRVFCLYLGEGVWAGGDVRRVSAAGGEAAGAEQHDTGTQGHRDGRTEGQHGSALLCPAHAAPGTARRGRGAAIGVGAASR